MGLTDLRRILTAEAFKPALEHEPMNPDAGVVFPRWPMGIPAVDQHVMLGGGIGLTTIAGDSGAGKSTVAYAAAAHALNAGWQVFYFDGENSDHQAKVRLQGAFDYLRVDDWMQRHLAKNGGLFHPRKMRPGITVEHLADYVSLHHEPMVKVLVIVDSVNRFASFTGLTQKSDSPNAYWRSIEKLTVWAMIAKDMMRGDFSAALISETNAAGIAKGRQLDFASDLALSIRKKGGGDRDLIVTKARDGGDGPLGIHRLSARYSRLERSEDSERRHEPQRIAAEVVDANVIPFTPRRLL